MNARALLLGLPIFLWSGLVLARDEGKVCAEAAERVQTLKERGKYAEARTELAACLKETCPPFVRDDCRVWTEELNRAQPMVVFSVHDDHGADLINVRVLIDGAVLREKLDGKSVDVDPGEHTIRFESEGFLPVEQKVLVVQNVKSRVMDVVMKAGTLPAASQDPARVTTPAADSSRDYTLPIVLGGVGVLGAGFFAFFEVRGQGQKDDIEKGCGATAARCSDDELSSARTSFRAAGVSLAVGALGITGAAAALWFAPKKSPVSVQTSIGGASLRVRF